MNFFIMYPVRCETCNKELAYLQDDLEQLLAIDPSVEKALNNLGVMRYCCRTNLMNPTSVFYDMENTDVVNGTRNVKEFTNLANPTITPIQIRQPISILQNLPSLGSSILHKSTIPSLSGTPVGTPVAIPIDESRLRNTSNFDIPQYVGVPTINPSKLTNPEVLSVGENNKIMTIPILTGRTYITG